MRSLVSKRVMAFQLCINGAYIHADTYAYAIQLHALERKMVTSIVDWTIYKACI